MRELITTRTQTPRDTEALCIKLCDLDLLDDLRSLENVRLQSAVDAGPVMRCEDILLDHYTFDDSDDLQPFAVIVELLREVRRKYRPSKGLPASQDVLDQVVVQNRAVTEDLDTLDRALQRVTTSGHQVMFSIRPKLIMDENEYGLYERQTWYCYLRYTKAA